MNQLHKDINTKYCCLLVIHIFYFISYQKITNYLKAGYYLSFLINFNFNFNLIHLLKNTKVLFGIRVYLCHKIIFYLYHLYKAQIINLFN